MVVQLFCLTCVSGLPVFVRKKGDAASIPFSHIAALNGLHLFAKSHDVVLHNTVTQDSVICWKEFHNSIILIAVASTVSSSVLDQFLDLVFKSMVLCLGIDELITIRNPERLKKELRVTYRIIDKLLDSLDSGDKTQATKTGSTSQKSIGGDIHEFVEAILCQENQTLQNCLDSYVEVVESLYGCITIHDRLAVATQSWWSLSIQEKKLLSILIASSNTGSSSTDVPVFLPHKSPSVPFRLVIINLINGVDICTLCGPTPSLTVIEQNVLQIWKPMIEILRSAEKTYPRNFPFNISLDSNILGFLLINVNIGKYLISRNLNKKESSSLSGSHRLNILKTFYQRSASTFLLPEDKKRKPVTDTSNDTDTSDTALETYWCSEYHKCHSLRSGDNLICVLYSASVPTITMRILTKQCLKTFTADKHLCW